MPNLFVIGDIHGCLNTLKELLKRWNNETDNLIQTGDFLDRGNFSPQTAEYLKQLKNTYPDKVVILKGNHEYQTISFIDEGYDVEWLRDYGFDAITQYINYGYDLKKDILWLKTLPLFWENENIFISHAGISRLTDDPFNENSIHGILWNKDPLKDIKRLQVVGHTPTQDGRPLYNQESNTLYIDTGAYKGKTLSAIRLTEKGELIETISINTIKEDITGLN